MPPVAKSIQGIVHDAVVALLGTASTAGELGTPKPLVLGAMRTNAFQSKKWPVVLVERPQEVASESAGYEYDRKTLRMIVSCIDTMGVKGAADLDRVRERVDLCLRRVQKVLRGSPHWGVAFLHLYSSMARYDVRDERADFLGNNMLFIEMEVEFAVTVEVGKIWEV